jgi:hypothetical protein
MLRSYCEGIGSYTRRLRIRIYTVDIVALCKSEGLSPIKPNGKIQIIVFEYLNL